MTSIHECEERPEVAGEWQQKTNPTTSTAEAIDIADKTRFLAEIQLILDTATLAFESDSTRIITPMMNGLTTSAFEIDAAQRTRASEHNLSHDSFSPGKERI